MRILTVLALGLFTSTAFAGSELQLKSSMPVQLFVDNESVGTVQPIEPLRVDISDGVHNLTIKGLMGKELYNRDLIFDDDTRTELQWQRKELRLGQVVPLDPKRPGRAVAETPPEVAAAPPAPAAPAPVAAAPVAAPPAPPAPVVAQAPAPPPAPQPVVVQQQPQQQQPQIVYVPVQQQPTYAATAPVAKAPVTAGANGSVVIQATENLDLQITHGTQLLRISVENGELVLRDSSGTQIRFPSNGQAF